MKAAVTTGKKGQIIVKEVPKPEVQPGQLLLKTRYCSICGSDLEYITGAIQYGGSYLREGTIMGHEFSAEVVAVGQGVDGWSVGERGTINSAPRVCGSCYYCRRGLYRLCIGGANSPGVWDPMNGAMAEYFVMNPNGLPGLLKVPEGISDEEAALVEPLANGVASVENAGLKPGDSVTIIGAGKIGLGAMLCAKLAGATLVIVIDIRKSRLDKALEMGADVVLNPTEVDVVPEVLKLTEVGTDAVLVCVRESDVLDQAAKMVRRGGTIVVTGVLGPCKVTPHLWLRKNLTLKSHYSGSCTTSLRLIAHKKIDVKPMISAVMPLEDVQEAFDSMLSGKNIVVLLKP